MVKSEMQKAWMETVLEQRLARVGAPEELWERVAFPRARQSSPRVHTSVNAARMSACATLAVAVIVLLWGFHQQSNVAALQFRSSDPGAIRSWVQAKTGIDVPLHAGHLAGANVNQGRAEIAYRVGGHDLTLRIGDVGSKNDNLLSWAAGGQTYMVACTAPEDLKACALCHAGG
jgi:hypothetical protein